MTQATATATDRPARSMKFPQSLTAAISFVILLAVAEIAISAFHVAPYIFPAPSAIAVRLAQDVQSGEVWMNVGITLLEVVLGFFAGAIAAVALGTAVARIRIVEVILLPYVLVIQTIPKIAIAPLFLIWFGFGLSAKVVSAALLAFFPIFVNVVSGLKDIDEKRIVLMRALRATPVQIFLKVRLPSMLPYFFAGMETGIVFAVLGALVGEYIGGSVGLGALVIQRQAAMDVAGVFSTLVFLSCMGVTLNGVVRVAKRRLVDW
ncbi:NitT/TauT family transport system permease protein [Bradyrhizobium macuxiense]|uniref:NitT/TauT family transport system permease protein n=1 Tax=Bradyrhizobium macuxiense TaxID=1755647 RepID=A0A560KX46_9BRAD|nr:ABC transporter permease [Bradyrhizobium macuxiense]TWB87803.1 NitT/TauT family transport system permease protein [Bradyrhizobium macuxiense]